MSFTLSAKSWTQNQIPTRAQPPTGSSHSRHMAGTQFKLKPQPKRTVNPTLSFSNHRWTPSLCSSTNQPSTTPGGQEGVSDLELAKMSSKLAKLGLAAVLAYGLFDGVTYTSFFVLAFLGYEKSTGNNPAANLKALLGIVVMMWTGNNITRPFRVAGAAALAPFIDKGLKRIQELFKFPHLVYAFSLVVAIVTTSCFTVVGLLILSRWGK